MLCKEKLSLAENTAVAQRVVKDCVRIFGSVTNVLITKDTITFQALWLWACHTVSNPAALATDSLEDLLQAVHNHARSARDRQMSGVPAGNSTHCQQHNSTSWTALGSVNRLRLGLVTVTF